MDNCLSGYGLGGLGSKAKKKKKGERLRSTMRKGLIKRIFEFRKIEKRKLLVKESMTKMLTF